MAVLPESMDKLNPEDIRGSLSILENYIRYMGERSEFAMRNTTRSVSAAGVSSAEMYVLLQAQINALSALTSTVNGQSGQLTSLGNQIAALNGSVQALEQADTTVNASIGAMQAEISGLKTQIDTMQQSIAGLETRVTALETPTTT